MFKDLDVTVLLLRNDDAHFNFYIWSEILICFFVFQIFQAGLGPGSGLSNSFSKLPVSYVFSFCLNSFLQHLSFAKASSMHAHLEVTVAFSGLIVGRV